MPLTDRETQILLPNIVERSGSADVFVVCVYFLKNKFCFGGLIFFLCVVLAV